MKRLLILASIVCIELAAEAKPVLPSMISNGMVMQQKSNVRLWGTTPHAGGNVVIKTSWSDKTTTCRADNDGNWQTEIATPAASYEPQTLTISDGEPVELSDVLIGEVWLAAGQSNMEMPLRGFDNCPVENSTETIITANEQRGVRIFTVPKEQSYEPQTQCKGEWRRSEARYAADFSATAFHFATTVSRALQVPVGIVVCAYGGSRVESWLPRDILKDYADIDLSKDGMEKTVGWERPMLMYNAMFCPVKRYTYKGVIWYQGESNVGHCDTFADRMETMVGLWRKEIGLGDIPFLSVEIAPYCGYGGNGALLRELQHGMARRISNFACVSTNDLVYDYERKQIHPCQKRQVGFRLALAALNKTYGQWWTACEGPTYKDMHTEGNRAVLSFSNAQGGFSRLLGIRGFEVAGEDHVFHSADTVTVGDKPTITVSSAQVTHPVAVRYCFHDFMPGNLSGTTGLPVVPFRTDNW